MWLKHGDREAEKQRPGPTLTPSSSSLSRAQRDGLRSDWQQGLDLAGLCRALQAVVRGLGFILRAATGRFIHSATALGTR